MTKATFLLPPGIELAFCPTGAGGGVDNSCGNTKGGVVFHGTSDKNLTKILAKGLIPGVSKGNARSKQERATAKDKVYMSKDFSAAASFAQALAQQGNRVPLVLEIKIPNGVEIFQDGASYRIGKDFFKLGDIPRSWIKGYYEVPFASGAPKRGSAKVKV